MREEDEDLEVCRPWTVGFQFTQHNAACPDTGYWTKNLFKVSRAKQKQDENVTAAMLLR